MYKSIILNSNLPRRIFIPFVQVDASSDKNSVANAHFETIQKKDGSKKFNLYSTTYESKNNLLTQVVNHQTMDDGADWHPKNWCGNLTAWKYDETQSNIPSKTDCPNRVELELSPIIASSSKFGMFLTWYPDGSEFKHILFGAGILKNPVGDKTNSTNNFPDSAIDEIAKITKREPFFLFDFPSVELYATDLDKSPTAGKFPWQGLYNFICGNSFKKKWAFKPEHLHLEIKNLESSNSGFAIALDFGTSATNIGILPMNGQDGFSGSIADPALDIIPWHQVSIFPSLKDEVCENVSDYEAVPYSEIAKSEKAYKSTAKMLNNRREVFLDSKNPQIPSLLYEPHPRKDPLEPMKTIDPDKDRFHSPIIGREAMNFVNETLSNSQTQTRNEWERYIFGPKSLVGSTVNQIEPKKYANGNMSTIHEKPTETYITELLNQAYFRVICNGKREHKISPPLDYFTYSHPVAWTERQRKDFHEMVISSLNKSHLRECIAEGKDAESIVSNGGMMDEASAAFLGFIMKRFDGLDGLELLRTFQPFDPSNNTEHSKLKPIHVLVFDCGEGTTDIVLLEIKPDQNLDARLPITRVVSNIIKHFAMPKAGLEVTRRIAEIIKDSMRSIKSNESPSEWLRTNFQDLRLEENQKGFSNMNKGDYRRKLTNLLYKLAEDVKVLGKPDKDYVTYLRQLTITKKDPEFSINQESLEDITKEVFNECAGQLRRWFKSSPRLDLLIMSGRSCRLSGLDTLILDSIPPSKRPYQIDFIKPGKFFLDGSERNNAEENTSKNVVCTGLALNLFNRININTSGVVCNPINQMFRIRAIGVMEQGADLMVKASFDARFPLLVDSDNAPIDTKEHLGPIIITSPETRGFTLGFNYSGLSKETNVFTADSVMPLARISINGGRSDSYSELRFYFRQINSSEVELSKIEIKKGAGEPKPKNVSPSESKQWIPLEGGLQVKFDPKTNEPDFRNTGKINITGSDGLDRDTTH